MDTLIEMILGAGLVTAVVLTVLMILGGILTAAFEWRRSEPPTISRSRR